VYQGRAVGMGRVVGDGAIYFYSQDMAVHPERQRRGLGTRIVQQVQYLAQQAPDKAFVGLFAAEGTLGFYEQFGFMQHPALTGMFRVTPV